MQPAQNNIVAYKGADLNLLYNLSDGTDPINWSTFTSIALNIYRPNSTTPELSITEFTLDANLLTKTISKEVIDGFAVQSYNYELLVVQSGVTKPYLRGSFFIDNVYGASSVFASADIVVNSVTQNITVSDSTSNAVIAVQAKNDAVTAKDQAVTAREGAETAQAGAVTAQGVATDQAGIATTQAGIATTGANTSTTQAGIATDEADRATTQADKSQDTSFRTASLFEDINNMKYGNIVMITAETGSSIPTPPEGKAYIFYDDGIKVKLSNGTIV